MPRIDPDAIAEEWDELDDERAASRPRRARAPAAAADLPVARVLGTHRGWVDVLVDGAEVPAVYGGAMRGEQVVVGDRVRVRPPRRATDTARIVDRLERDTVLLRTADDAVAEERLVAANVEQAIAVVAVGEGEVGARFLDRILVAAEAGRLAGAVCLNKCDLLGTELGDEVAAQTRAIADRYRDLGYPVVVTSAVTGEGLDELGALLAGRWSVLAGHSGVGKTSLTNRLVPGAEREVGEVGRFGGRHTTVSPRALRVPGHADTWLVDTPGVRSFGIAHVAPDELAWTFPELRGLDCELPGCLHDGEPGCAVPDVLGDHVHPARYASYQRFLAVLRGSADE